MTTLGRYHLAEALGEGPTGQVYRAKVLGVAGYERQFALKVFHPALPANSLLGERVAGAGSQYRTLDHPGVARLHELATESGSLFAATEWVDGIDLKGLFSAANDALSMSAALRIVLDAARVLAYAHAQGVVHLGIAPSNVFVTSTGGVKVTDFGFLDARLHARAGLPEELGARRRYLAPEQLEGRATGPSADVYGLGVLALELLNRVKGVPEAVRGAVGGTMPGVRPRAAVPGPIAEVLRRAIAGRPEERFPDGMALAEALERSASDWVQPGARAELVRWVRTFQAGAIGTSGIVVAIPQRAEGAAGEPTAPSAGAGAARSAAGTVDAYLARATDTLTRVARQARAEEGEARVRAPGSRQGPPSPRGAELPPPLYVADAETGPAHQADGAPAARHRIPRSLLGAAALLAGLGAVVALVWRADDARVQERRPSTAERLAPDEPAPGDRPAARAESVPRPSPLETTPPKRALLGVTTDPPGAMVYLDGSLKGRTPLELPETNDRHKLTLILPGFQLVRTEVQGSGRVDIALEPAVTFRGPAGIKVRCRSKNRLYVTVDGTDTGWLCPTERIKVSLGEHTVDIYDPVTDTVTSKKVLVEDTHYSVRVRVNM